MVGLHAVTVFFHHFPVFTLCLATMSPGNVPGGVSFTIERCSASEAKIGIRLCSHGMGLGDILKPYLAELGNSFERFSVPNLLKRFVLGEPIVEPLSLERLPILNEAQRKLRQSVGNMMRRGSFS